MRVGVVSVVGQRNGKRSQMFRAGFAGVLVTGSRRARVLLGLLLVGAVLISGSGVGSAGLAKLATLTGASSGLKTPMDPVVKVGKGAPGSGTDRPDSPNWKPEPVKAVPVGSATAVVGEEFARAGALPVSVASAATGQVVIAEAVESAEGKLTPAEQAAALKASQKAAAPEEKLVAGGMESLLREIGDNAPGLLAGRPNKGNAGV
jgi:hypothetical protein